ncbi:MAG: J domain-containing protein [Microthrixaceae bacterium]|nr:J domain-containing protein [Acidimicrobiales bacterium]MCB9404531.1 J domain-containing protein [Microthrixaceae bacterium]
MNHYEVLGVPEDSRPGEIRAAYLELARQHHPDFHVADPPAEREAHVRRMKAITEAWDVLGDTARRRSYDERLLGGRASPAKATAVERQRERPEPTVPAGKTWTPRPGDDRWMNDHAGWAAERDRILPDEDVRDGGGHPARLAPVAIFVLSVLAGFVGLAVESRHMLAACIGGVILSSAMFIVLPLLTMTRHSSRGMPNAGSRRTPFGGT